MKLKEELRDSDVARLQMDDGIVMQLGSKMYSQSTWWVLLRELIQNALDARATKLSIETDWSSYLIVEENGEGMTKEELLGVFLTVGGTDKVRKDDTVGGFGIAKLAIFSCDDFTVISNTWTLTKEMLLKHEPLTRTEGVGEHGTWIRVDKKNLFSYSVQEELKWFLKSIDRENVEILLNNVEINQFDQTLISIDNYGDVLSSNSSPQSGEGYMMVRLNGIPMFRERAWACHQNLTMFFDVKSTLNPYDDDYPFTMTRDDFNSSNKSDWDTFRRKVDEHFTKINLFEKRKKVNLFYNEINGIWLAYNAIPSTENMKQLNSFKKLIMTLYSLEDNLKGDEIGFGLIGKSQPQEVGAYMKSEEGNIHIFLLTELSIPPARIISTALHEFTHRFHPDHYENFADKMTTEVEKFLTLMGMFQASSLLPEGFNES